MDNEEYTLSIQDKFNNLVNYLFNETERRLLLLESSRDVPRDKGRDILVRECQDKYDQMLTVLADNGLLKKFVDTYTDIKNNY